MRRLTFPGLRCGRAEVCGRRNVRRPAERAPQRHSIGWCSVISVSQSHNHISLNAGTEHQHPQNTDMMATWAACSPVRLAIIKGLQST